MSEDREDEERPSIDWTRRIMVAAVTIGAFLASLSGIYSFVSKADATQVDARIQALEVSIRELQSDIKDIQVDAKAIREDYRKHERDTSLHPNRELMEFRLDQLEQSVSKICEPTPTSTKGKNP